MLRRFRPWILLLLFAVLCGVAYERQIHREMADFHVYRVAGARALNAEPLYQAGDGHYQFKYLPAFALAMMPVGALPVDHAKLFWFVLSAGLLLVFVRWSVHALPDRRRSETVLRWLTVLFMLKFYAHELTLGQTNLLLGTVLVGGFMALQAQAPRLAGVLIGLAIFVKPYAVLLLPWLLFSSGLRAAAIASGVLICGLLLPALQYGWSGNLDLLAGWYHTVTDSTSGNLLGADNVSIAAMWSKWLGIGPTATGLTLLTIVASLGLVVITWLRRRTMARPDYLEYALLMLLIPLISPQGWDYVLLLGTPAVACLLDRWPGLSPPWKIVSMLALSLMGLTIFDIMGRALYGRFMALSLVTVAALGVTVCLVHLRATRQA